MYMLCVVMKPSSCLLSSSSSSSFIGRLHPAPSTENNASHHHLEDWFSGELELESLSASLPLCFLWVKRLPQRTSERV